MKQTCSRCKYFDRNGAGVGLCRINPPIVIPRGDRAWPLIKTDDWCGKWSPNAETAREMLLAQRREVERITGKPLPKLEE